MSPQPFYAPVARVAVAEMKILRLCVESLFGSGSFGLGIEDYPLFLGPIIIAVVIFLDTLPFKQVEITDHGL